MTDQFMPEAAQEPQDTPETTQDTPQVAEVDPLGDGAQEPMEGDGGNREAARYRRRLRQTETERDQLAQRLAGAQRREVERLAGDHLADPGDLWQTTDLSALLGDDGDVDADKVTSAVEALIKAKPHYGRRAARPKPDPGQGPRGSSPAVRLGDIFRRS